MSKFYIGAAEWSGISKLVEEAGEVVQVCGKLLGTNGDAQHWDGSNLARRLEEELGDLEAAIEFVISMNPAVSRAAVQSRMYKKLSLFTEWHDNTRVKEGNE